MRDTIRFLKNGQLVTLNDVGPTDTVLDYLRLTRLETGTKEGCGEGDCGACTVAVGRLVNGELQYSPVNSCIQLVGMLDGAELVCVNDLAMDGTMHPVQQALADMGGSQCGFCTPGFVMSLFTLYHQKGKSESRKAVTEWLSGNLCRCTGYRPIVDAAMESCFKVADDVFSARSVETIAKLRELDDKRDVFIGTTERFLASPATIEGLASLYHSYPDATLVAGATDVGLWITKQLRDLPRVIWLGRLDTLSGLEESDAGVLLGASVTYQDAEDAMTRLSPDLGALWKRIGSKQVRASGTVGGNIANGSPIGDTPPALIALGATLELHSTSGSRTLALEDYFIEYGKQDRREGEFVSGVFIPRPLKNQIFRCYKISKRFDQDISSVMAAFLFTVGSNGSIDDARIAYGGMAGTPRRALGAEKSLIGASLENPSNWSVAMQALNSDFKPMSDMRAGAEYRKETARALLAKALMEASGTAGPQIRLRGPDQEAAE
ncbi:MAG: xanthine dehydrogenase small subunit [Rhodobacteraceae bacterium]|nr:xanthine dehydrogenase small subunit [Paracoccaceae bacterium]